jgi:septum formation protein
MPDSDHTVPIILASASPRRRQLLALMGVSFQVVASDVDEVIVQGEAPQESARRLSIAKAEAVAELYPKALIIAADTLVVLDDDVLGKPTSPSSAFDMLARLRNRQHIVYSGLTVMDTEHARRCSQVARTPVTMRDYSTDEMRQYIATGDPMDKAGAYALQHTAFNPVACLEECYANVMGLPMCHLYRILYAWDVAIPIHPLACCPLAVGEGCTWSAAITHAPMQMWCLEHCACACAAKRA